MTMRNLKGMNNMDKLDLTKYLFMIKDLKYFIIKLETPYVPKDFPQNYAIGKDIDLIVSIDDFEKIKEITKYFSNEYSEYNIILHDSDSDCFRLRFENNNNKLHYQIDIRTSLQGITNEHIQKCLEYRIMNNNYYILPPKLERVFRELEYIRYGNSKPWHKDWLDNNKL